MKKNITVGILLLIFVGYVYGLRIADLSETPTSKRPHSPFITASAG